MIATEVLHTSEEAAERAGVSYRQLDYWVTLGIIEPTEWNRNASGSGSRRRWSDTDIDRIRTASLLKGVGGLSTSLIATAIRSDANWLGIADGVMIEQLNTGEDLLAFISRHEGEQLAIVRHMRSES